MADACSNRDLVSSWWGCLYWCLPVALLVAGDSWTAGRVWLWVPALVIAGTACVVNAGRCGRLHCYITGPFYMLAALYVVLAEFKMVPLQPGRFLWVVLGITVAAFLAEIPFGRYTRKAGSAA